MADYQGESVALSSSSGEVRILPNPDGRVEISQCPDPQATVRLTPDGDISWGGNDVDAELSAAIAFGTAFRRPDALVNYLEKKDKDYAGSSIANHGALAVPAVYVIDANGLIVFDYVNANYNIRLPADDVLADARRNRGE